MAIVHVGGTDSAPTVFASPRPADMAGAGADGTIGPVIIAGNSVGGTVPVPGQGSTPAQPLTISSVWKPVRAPATSKGRDTAANGASGVSIASVARALGASRKTVIRLLNVLSGLGGSAAAAGAAVARLCSALGTAEKACWADETVFCTLPAEVLVDEGPLAVRELIELGARFDRTAGGELALTREGGHRRNRIAHAGGDAGLFSMVYGGWAAGEIGSAPVTRSVEPWR